MTAGRTDLAGVITQPDRPAGRGQRLRATPVKAAALELGIPVYEPATLRGFAQDISDERFDLFVLASYGKILPQALLDQPGLGALNVHPSLLPKFRGSTPIQTALLEGERETGVSIMLMDAGMDTGEIVLQERTAIGPQERYGELHDRLAQLGADALNRAFDLAANGTIPHAPQTGEASVTRPLRKEDLDIDWRWPAQKIINAVRAFAPAPAARAQLRGTPVKILRARVSTAYPEQAKPGEVSGVAGEAAVVRCIDGAVEVIELVPRSRPPMSGAVFAR